MKSMSAFVYGRRAESARARAIAAALLSASVRGALLDEGWTTGV